MGKRKSSRKPGAGKVKAKPLDKSFRCLFCQHVNSVSCRIDRSNRIGRLDCKDCLQSFQAAITPLDEAVDLYSMWIDACDAVNQPAPVAARSVQRNQSQQKDRHRADQEDDDDDDDLPDIGRPNANRRASNEAEDDEDEEDEGVASSKSKSASSAPRNGTSKQTVVEDDEDDD